MNNNQATLINILITLTLFRLGRRGGGHIVPALTLTNYNFSKRLDVNFPKTYEGNISCVNDVSMMIDISIADIYSGMFFDCFLSVFSSVCFPGFFPFLCKKKAILSFFVLVLIKHVS